MKALRAPLARLAALLAGVTLFWACNAPFIPVPPPGAAFTSALVDDGSGGQKTVWITHGLPSENASFGRFSIFNQNLGVGVITTAELDGSYDAPPLDGAVNDRVQIYYQTPEGDYSDSICLLLSETVPPALSAPACPP
jgi:hypothetical protein